MAETSVSFESGSAGFLLASSATPISIFYSPDSAPAIVIAVNTFADDVERVTGKRPEVKSSDAAESGIGIHVGTITSSLIKNAHSSLSSDVTDEVRGRLEGKWECWDVSVRGDKALVTGSCRVSFAARQD